MIPTPHRSPRRDCAMMAACSANSTVDPRLENAYVCIVSPARLNQYKYEARFLRPELSGAISLRLRFGASGVLAGTYRGIVPVSFLTASRSTL